MIWNSWEHDDSESWDSKCSTEEEYPDEEAENSAVGQERDWNDHNYAEPAIDHDGLLCRNCICSTQIWEYFSADNEAR